jgi:FkbM family methyltransferase
MKEHPIFDRFQPVRVDPPDGFVIDSFLGTIRRAEINPADQGGFAFPPTHDEEYEEWVDLLEAVEGAQGTFVMVELGAGYGRWSARGALACRQRGLGVQVLCVEAEPTHFRWLGEHLEHNGVSSEQRRCVHAAVGGEDGDAWLSVSSNQDPELGPSTWYGQAVVPVRSGMRGLIARLARRGTVGDLGVEKVTQLSLGSLLSSIPRVALIDCDVQGAEAAVFEGGMEAVDEKVARVHIGTHSSEVEARLRSLFSSHGWNKRVDYACGELNSTEYGEIQFQDGVQSWVNPSLS